MKKPYLKLIYIVVFVLFAIPGVKLLLNYIDSRSNSYILEIDDNRKFITRYAYKQGSEIPFLNLKENRTLLNQKQVDYLDLNEYYQTLYSDYRENNLEIDNFEKQRVDDPSEDILAIKEGVSLLSENNVNILGEGKQINILHSFDGSFNSNSLNSSAQKKANALDEKYEEIDFYVNDKNIKSLQRDPNFFRVINPKKFKTSPKPKTQTNTLNDLLSLELRLDKEYYYSFEVARANLVATNSINLDDLKIYVGKGSYLIPNIGGKIDMFFRYINRVMVGSLILGYNPSPGEYDVYVRSKSLPQWKGLKVPFRLKRRNVEPVKKGFSVVNFEYANDIRYSKIPIPNVKGESKMTNYTGLVDWVKFMGVDAFWVLGGHTTGWSTTVNKTNPWHKTSLRNVELLSKVCSPKGVKMGAYMISYFTPGNGKKKAGYEPSLSYDPKTDKIKNSLHISLADNRRLQDLINLAKKFEKNDGIDFIGLDFIRTGHSDGYEMVDEFVIDMNVRTPSDFFYWPLENRIKWLGKQIKILKNTVTTKKWHWWRAHKVATIANKIITEGQISKPMWVFTLGWMHGVEHGQDPYMFFDAGIFIDAVMLYEANYAQFMKMMRQWPNYMRNDNNNLFIGNSSDVRLLDAKGSGINHPAKEYLFRSQSGYRRIYKKSYAKGIFMHDLSRALWSRSRGVDVMSWAIIHGHTTSAFRQELGLIPYKADIYFYPNKNSGRITIKNLSDKRIKNIQIKHVVNGDWKLVKDNVSDTISLEPNEVLYFDFICERNKEVKNKFPVLGYYLDHPKYPKYFFYTYK